MTGPKPHNPALPALRVGASAEPSTRDGEPIMRDIADGLLSPRPLADEPARRHGVWPRLRFRRCRSECRLLRAVAGRTAGASGRARCEEPRDRQHRQDAARGRDRRRGDRRRGWDSGHGCRQFGHRQFGRQHHCSGERADAHDREQDRHCVVGEADRRTRDRGCRQGPGRDQGRYRRRGGHHGRDRRNGNRIG